MKLEASKVVFFISIFAFGVFYGIASNKLNFFPQPQLRKAWNQAEVAFAFGGPGNQPNVYDRDGVRVSVSKSVQSGVTLVSTSRQLGAGAHSLKVLDIEGRVLHKWSIKPGSIFRNIDENLSKSRLSGATLYKNGDVIFNLSYIGTVRFNSCGKVEWKTYSKGHHSVEKSENGGVWVAGVSQEKINMKYPGFGRAWSETILHISGSGEITKRFNLMDIIFKNNLQRHLVKTRVNNFEQIGDVVDITHMNDVEPLSPPMALKYPLFDAGDLLVSLRAANLVFVFDPNTGNVKWHASLPFIAQHDPDFIGRGWVGVFDNRTDGTERGSMLGGSRIVAVKPGADSTRVLFPTPESDSFYTDVQGKWQYLQNGNMLLSEATRGRAIEVDSEGRTVWEFVESNVSSMHAWRYSNITRNKVASWPCSSVDFAQAPVQSR